MLKKLRCDACEAKAVEKWALQRELQRSQQSWFLFMEEEQKRFFTTEAALLFREKAEVGKKNRGLWFSENYPQLKMFFPLFNMKNDLFT